MKLTSPLGFALVCLLLAATQSALAAEASPAKPTHAPQHAKPTATFAQVSVTLPIPSGYCEIPRTSPEGQRFYSLQEQGNAGSNVVALLFADCAEWAKHENDPSYRVRRYGSYLFQLSDGKESLVPAEYSRALYVKEVSGIDLDGPQIVKDADERLSQATIKAASIKTASVAPIDADGNGAYVLLMATMNYPHEAAHVCAIMTVTVARQVPVSMNLYHDFEGNESVRQLLRAQKLNARALVQENQ